MFNTVHTRRFSQKSFLLVWSDLWWNRVIADDLWWWNLWPCDKFLLNMKIFHSDSSWLTSSHCKKSLLLVWSGSLWNKVIAGDLEWYHLWPCDILSTEYTEWGNSKWITMDHLHSLYKICSEWFRVIHGVLMCFHSDLWSSVTLSIEYEDKNDFVSTLAYTVEHFKNNILLLTFKF